MTYAEDSDVEFRLNTGDYQSLVSDQIENCRDRAYRDIQEEFVKNGLESPDTDGDDVGVLVDIEADLAAYYYRRDRAEFNDEEKGYKERMWKKDAYSKLERYINARHGNMGFMAGGGGN